jgi:hypothetical protein
MSNMDRQLLRQKSCQKFVNSYLISLQLLATIGMIYGFVEINSPEKMVGASNEAVEGIIHEELETSADDNLDDDDDYCNCVIKKPHLIKSRTLLNHF